MVKKKILKKKKVNSDALSWEEIGLNIGKKMENEFNNKNKMQYYRWYWSEHPRPGAFIGRTLFIIGVLIALNTLKVTSGLSIWVQILIVIGFAFMKF